MKKTGYGEVFDPLKQENHGRISEPSHDIYARDRILFKPKTRLNKHGTFGDFWARGWNEKKLWSLICEETATVERNYAVPWIKSLVHSIHERLGIPLCRVKWAYCLNPPVHLRDAGRVIPDSARCRGGKTGSRRLVRSVFGPRRRAVPAQKNSWASRECGRSSGATKAAGANPASCRGTRAALGRSSVASPGRRWRLGANGAPYVPNRKKATPSREPQRKPSGLHQGLIEALASLGLTATPAQVEEAMKSLPDGGARLEESQLIRQIFLELRKKG